MSLLPKTVVVSFLALLLVLLNGSVYGQSRTTAETNFCSLVHSPSTYIGKTVHFRAFMTWSTVTRVDGGDSFFFSPNCNNGDSFALANFTRSADSKQIQAFFKKLKPETHFVFEVDATGEFDSAFPATFGHLDWALHEIELTEIRSIHDISLVRPELKPDFEAKTPITDLGRKLSSLTVDVVSHFSHFTGYRDDLDVARYFAADLKVVGPTGKTLTNGQIDYLVKEGLFDTSKTYENRFVRHPSIKMSDAKFIAFGRVGVNGNLKTEKSLKYECTFRRTADDLVVEKIVFSEN
jgi:hypothetical protein